MVNLDISVLIRTIYPFQIITPSNTVIDCLFGIGTFRYLQSFSLFASIRLALVYSKSADMMYLMTSGY